MKTNKGNVTVFAVIIVTVAITAGTIGWMFAKKSQAPLQQSVITQQSTAPTPQTQLIASLESQPQTTNSIINAPADWKTYQDDKLGYQFSYPSSWKLVAYQGNNPKLYNVSIFEEDDGSGIQIVNVANGYGENADGSISNRESLLKKLSNNDDKISIGGGTGYLYIDSESKGGPHPTVYLVGDKQILLMSYSIPSFDKLPLSDAKKLFKQIISTFKYIN